MSPIKRGRAIGYVAARGGFAFTVFVGDRERMVLIEDRALRDLCRRANVEAGSRDEAFRALRAPIETVAFRKCFEEIFEPDGSVIVTHEDVK